MTTSFKNMDIRVCINKIDCMNNIHVLLIFLFIIIIIIIIIVKWRYYDYDYKSYSHSHLLLCHHLFLLKTLSPPLIIIQ